MRSRNGKRKKEVLISASTMAPRIHCVLAPTKKRAHEWPDSWSVALKNERMKQLKEVEAVGEEDTHLSSSALSQRKKKRGKIDRER